MKLEIEITEGDDLTWLKVWHDHSALVAKSAPNAGIRLMAVRVYQALESVLGKAKRPFKKFDN
jgi:hypothetical protein